ncbi:Hypothetical predicted protein [Pelobates cultripes]|uniref:Uncharacterized protein n=1 Tax=Pelobates cultripes TaxID=61616 RepID=A0AAD1SPH4_PELCU|nr:Hypothetical predicted protein [Pelobates cultripes]
MDQWLKTGTVRKLTHNVDIDQSPIISQDKSNPSVQNDEKVESSLLRTGKKRKYCDEYMNCPKALCAVYGEELTNGSMKPSLILRHLHTKHASYTNKECRFFSVACETSEYDVSVVS